jgi:hypothetical protein
MPKRGESKSSGKKKVRKNLTMEMIMAKAAEFAPPVRTLRDMSEPEIRNLEKFYGCPVIRPT